MIKKSVALLAVAMVALTSCKQENASLRIDEETSKKAEMVHANSGKLPVAKFDSMDHDFGSINEGDKVEHVYKFKNEGTADLVISNAKASCGCTVPEYTNTPVKPGDSGEIKVVFDSNGKGGAQQKTVTLTLNTEKGTEMLNFKADVKPKAGPATTTAPAVAH